MNYLTVGVLLISCLVIPISRVEACVRFEQVSTFYERIRVTLDLTSVTAREKFYFRFAGTLEELNILMNSGYPVIGTRQEPVFPSLETAQAQVSTETRYIVAVNKTSGQAVDVFTVDGRRLELIVGKGGCSVRWAIAL